MSQVEVPFPHKMLTQLPQGETPERDTLLVQWGTGNDSARRLRRLGSQDRLSLSLSLDSKRCPCKLLYELLPLHQRNKNNDDLPMKKFKVKPSLQSKAKSITKTKHSTRSRSSARVKLQSIDLAKVKNYLKTEIDHLLHIPDVEVPNYLQEIRSFSALGRYIYGFRWSSTGFHSDNAQARGDQDDRAELLQLCLRAAIKFVSERAEAVEREVTSSVDGLFNLWIRVSFDLL